MILERHLRALLKRLGIDEYGPPGLEQWLALLAQMSDQLRHYEDDKHRLQRSLDIHGRELQSLYRELMTERDHLSSALACLTQGFIVFDAHGHPALMNAEAEQWLGWSEQEVSGRDLLGMLELEQVFQVPDLQERLSEGHSLAGRGFFTSKSGSRFLASVHLQPILRDGQLSGSVLTFEPPILEGQLAGRRGQNEAQPRQLQTEPDWFPQEATQEDHFAAVPPRVDRREAVLMTPLGEGEGGMDSVPEPVPVLAEVGHGAYEPTVSGENPSLFHKFSSPALSQSTPLAATSTPPPVLPPPAQPALHEMLDTPAPPPAPLPEVMKHPPVAPSEIVKAYLNPPAPAANKSVERAARPLEKAPEKPVVVVEKTDPRKRGLRILLVENESVSQMVTQSVLAKLGHDCTLAESGEEGLQLHQESPFDAIISTYLMPGMDGIALCRLIREDPQGGYPYFILLTAMDKREEATRALEAGVDAFLTKPLDANDLAIRLKVAKGVQTRLTRVYSEFAAGGEI